MLIDEAKYFEPGPSILEEMTGKPIFVAPYLLDIDIAEHGLRTKLGE